MVKFLNHNTGKLINTEDENEIPKTGIVTTGWEQIYPEFYNKLVDTTYNFPSWDYPRIKMAKKVRENPENKHLLK